MPTFFLGAMDYEAILEKVETAVAPVLDHLGYELVEREYVQAQGRWVLRLYIGRADDGSVTLDDCVEASRALEGVLDVEDVIPHPYCLEVSSPGIERPLRHRGDFERFRGAVIDLKAKAPVQGRRHFSGVLKGMEKEHIMIEDERGLWQVPFTLLKKAKIKRR
ncbi:MAG: ribosome maturation factor RimP [Deltaproteobacteria bacterium]|nr:ribosome maturation factor RimP [Deltaproteobacteria bacterium]